MPLFGVTLGEYPGLDLRDAADSTGGAIDMLNVDLDVVGRLRARDGFTKFTTAAAAGPMAALTPMPTTAGAGNILALPLATQTVRAINASTGVLIALSGTVLHEVPFKLAVVATGAGAGVAYAPGNTAGNGIMKWDGAAFSNVATTFGLTASGFAHQTPVDNRLMLLGGVAGGNSIASLSSPVVTPDGRSLVIFSDAGKPENYTVNNYVQLTPGDGQYIIGVCTYANQVFVFKQTKFFVFTGTSTDPGGNAVFNYRTVDVGIGAGTNAGGSSAFYGACCTAADGVYFAASDGIYKTTGGAPIKVSAAIDPLFGVGGPLPPYFQGAAVNTSTVTSMQSYHNRIFFTYTGLVSGTRLMLVYDIPTQAWMLWDVSALGLCANPVGGGLLFGYAGSVSPTATNDIGAFSSAATTDAGTAISARYRSGFISFDYAGRTIKRGIQGVEKTVREAVVDGSGTVNFVLSKQWVRPANLPSVAALTLGTSPQVAQARDRRAVRARMFSYQLSGVAPWTVEKLVLNLRGFHEVGLQESGA